MIGVCFTVSVNNKMSIEVKVEISIITYQVCLMELLFPSLLQHQCSTELLTLPHWGLAGDQYEAYEAIVGATKALLLCETIPFM